MRSLLGGLIVLGILSSCRTGRGREHMRPDEIPTRGAIDTRILSRIEKEKTDRVGVLLLLGEPDEASPAEFVYTWTTVTRFADVYYKKSTSIHVAFRNDGRVVNVRKTEGRFESWWRIPEPMLIPFPGPLH